MNTTIQISTDLRDQIKELGNKGETYEEILLRMVSSAKEHQLRDLLMSEKGTITIAEARKRLK